MQLLIGFLPHVEILQTAIIKTCAYNNRFALKCAFGESYNDLYPGTIYSPPSYNVRFHQLLRVVDTIYLPSFVFSIMGISTH